MELQVTLNAEGKRLFYVLIPPNMMIKCALSVPIFKQYVCVLSLFIIIVTLFNTCRCPFCKALLRSDENAFFIFSSNISFIHFSF